MNKALQIPAGWKEKRLKDVGKCLTGLTYTPKDVTDDSGLLVLRSSNVQGGKLVFDDNVYVKRDVSVKNYTQSGDILVCVRNGSSNLIGKNAIVTADGNGLPHGAFMMLFRSKHYQYLYQLFSSEMYNKQVYRNLGATINSINSSDFYKFRFLFPPLPEQKAIAALLSTWDEAIEKTERLIQVKEKRFKQLLNDLIHQGRSNHTWKGYNLSDLCSPVSRKNGENNTNVLTSSAQNGLVSQIEYYNKSVSAENVTGYYLLKKGEFAYNRSSAKGYPYGATKRLDRYEKGVLSTLYLCFALKPDAPCESDFLLHLFESGAANRELRAVCQEGARSHGLLNITKADFFGIKLFLPSQDQQKKIQSALNTAQNEIALLKQLAEKYKTQKRGLMQKMLTGEWRVKPEIVNQYMEA